MEVENMQLTKIFQIYYQPIPLKVKTAIVVKLVKVKERNYKIIIEISQKIKLIIN